MTIFCHPQPHPPGRSTPRRQSLPPRIRTSRPALRRPVTMPRNSLPRPPPAMAGFRATGTPAAQVLVTARVAPSGRRHVRSAASGTVYRQSDWSPVVRLKGQVPVTGQVYQLERLRCHGCGHVFTAELPAEAGPDKYDRTVTSVVGDAAVWGGNAGPSPATDASCRPACPCRRLTSGNWCGMPEQGPRNASNSCCVLAAQGDLVHHDDTTMRVLELTEKKKRNEPLREDDPQRSGVFTTSVLSLAPDRPTIALFFTGPYHAGENFARCSCRAVQNYHHRFKCAMPCRATCPKICTRSSPIASCTEGANFVDVVEYFRDEVTYVVECLKQVYQIDAQAKQQQFTPEERLRLHQATERPRDGRTAALAAGAVRRETGGTEFIVGRGDRLHAQALAEADPLLARATAHRWTITFANVL